VQSETCIYRSTAGHTLHFIFIVEFELSQHDTIYLNANIGLGILQYRKQFSTLKTYYYWQI